ncbi:MAG TPA: hypothetical protein PKN57_11520 [Saprospiraceae bacterium]|jgi:hypothetical protein|nr:hypothetical protein [Saprospiraceae bacterium]HMV24724.1 hypothetical protein [Saprospiraceae bacterium]HMW75446.1 hypothetical protein [Saprospiraceae bacterium]HMX82994.1 hypothetical protein [Saprospiraceae bacterium]HMX85871.1 hypothetical protein [Saprospiraceae bacterium]
MSKKQIWLILLALATVYLVIKFRQERVINRSLVDAKVQEIVMFEKAEYEKTCKKDALRQAAVVVDSLLQVWGEQSSFDTTGRPPLPFKPTAPDFQSPLDRVTLKPLFDSIQSIK